MKKTDKTPIIIPRPEHPEPMMYRKNWQNLNGEWLFSLDYGNSGKDRELYRVDSEKEYSERITVPFCVESKLSGIEKKDFISSVWYKRKIKITGEQLKGRVLLHFGAVDYQTDLYVNGEFVGNHFGGYSSFSFDITEFLHIGENDVTVNATDDVRSCNQPSGKQSRRYDSFKCSYTRTTGIWQTVWLEFVPKAYIKSVRYYPDINEGAFDIELSLAASGVVTFEATYEGKPMGKVTRKSRGNNLRIRLPLSEIHLWEPGCGRLYDIKISLKTGSETDELQSYAGLRDIKIDGFKVLINGKSVFQRTVLDQGFYPDGIYTAPSDEDLKKDIELSMKLGFNGARLHEKMFEPRFLYYCDKLGYLVWGEHANWGLDVTTPAALLNFLPEWVETVNRDFNHPAIIGWCPFNEERDFRGRERLARVLETVYKVTKSIDSTRPVIDTSGDLHVVTDIFDQHDYEQNPEIFRKSYFDFDGTVESFRFRFPEKQIFTPNVPFFLSEFGGIKWVPQDRRSEANKNAWGYGDAPQTEEEFFTRYEELTKTLMEAPNIMGFCYTQLYDVEQETNGLYTYEREEKFADYSRIITANTKKAAIED